LRHSSRMSRGRRIAASHSLSSGYDTGWASTRATRIGSDFPFASFLPWIMTFMKTASIVSFAFALGLMTSAAALPLAAQAATTAPAPKSMEHHGASSGWKELDAFHELMAATWHPAKSGDLKAIRAKADSLSASAKVWAASKVPSACDTKPIRDAIADVVAGSAKVAQMVANNGADADVRTALSDVHDRFEVVEHGCQPKHH
jgi:hypothetical protein